MNLKIFGKAQADTFFILSDHAGRNVIDKSLVFPLGHFEKRALLVSGDNCFLTDGNFRPLLFVRLFFAVLFFGRAFTLIALRRRAVYECGIFAYGDLLFVRTLIEFDFEILRKSHSDSSVLVFRILADDRVGQIVAVSRELSSRRCFEKRCFFVVAEHRLAGQSNDRLCFLLPDIVLVGRMVYDVGKLLRRKFYLVAVTVTKVNDLSFRKHQLVAKLSRIRLHFNKLTAVFDAVVIHEIGIVRVFLIARRHPHERGLVIRLDERVPRYIHGVPLLLRFHVFAVIFLTVFVRRFFVFEIVDALRPRSVRRIVADSNGIVVPSLHHGNISAVFVLRNAYDLIAA